VTVSRECQAIIDYVESSGLPYRVTSVVRHPAPGEKPTSYHEQEGTDGDSLAVDFAGVTPGVTPTTAAQMADIYRLFLLVGAQLAELIHSGSGIGEAIKNGRLVEGAAVFGPVTWPDHRDHVHVAVPKGTILKPLSQALGTLEETMTDSPDLPNIEGPLQLQILMDQDGNATGYAIFSTKTGELHGYGPGWKYFGRSEDPTP
jgi:hypothetical protein